MKKYCATFKLFGKKYGIRKGSNLHAIGVLVSILGAGAIAYILLCLLVGLGGTL